MTITFDMPADLKLDAALIAQDLDEQASADDLISMLSAYGGELLPGFYDDWVVLERERTYMQFERKMSALLDRLIEARRWEDVLQWGERWIALGSTPEPAYRALMIAYAALGDASKVAETYHRCAEALQRELGVEPSKQTQALHEQIRERLQATPLLMESLSRQVLLHTKLVPPAAGPSLVKRPRLTQRLNDGMTRRLTTISAPAGFGKTTLLSEWILQSQHPVAWVSLDAGDNDPVRFWSYLIAALQTLYPNIGASAHALLQSPQMLPLESVLSLLLNDIDAVRNHFSLVLDDLHVIESTDVQRGLNYFLEHAPSHMHLIISSRANPSLPIAHWRARDQLVEVRAADLRFTVEESSAFLNQVMGLHLAPEQIALLEARTEGWIAGLQMAALSMREREDVGAFIATFAGSHRFILDYLTEEVLRLQPLPVQNFLLQTSILKRMSAALCSAVVGQDTNTQALLEQLERANLFIIPLDDERRWYRYHHLFADLLQSRLQEVQPEAVPELHRRAAEWYEQNGFVEDAVEHALATARTTRDFERAVRLIEGCAQSLMMRGELKTLQAWLDAVPHDALRAHPRLSFTVAWTLVFTNHLDEAEQHVLDLERELGAAPGDGLANWKLEVLVLQAAIASGRRDTPRTIVLSTQALEQLPHDHFYRCVLALYLGYAYQGRGEAQLTLQAFSEAAQLSEAAGNLLVATIALGNIGQLHTAQGHLREASEFYDRAVRLAARYGGKALPITGPTLMGIGALLCERNELNAATRTIRDGIERGAQLGGVVVDVFGDLTLAQLKRAQGDIDGALQIIGQAEARLKSHSLTNRIRGLEAYRVQLWLVQRNPAAAAWAAEREREPHGDDMRWAWRWMEDVTLARVLITQARDDPGNPALLRALELLQSLQRAIEAEGRVGNVIELLMLQALARHAQGDDGSALSQLERALNLAEPEGFVRLFVSEGEPLAALLQRMQVEGKRIEAYLAKLLAAFRVDSLLTSTPSLIPLPSSVLDEPLTARELEVLRLMDSGLSNREIAERFVVSINNVKTQVKSIYSKLGVRGREEALEAARALQLL